MFLSIEDARQERINFDSYPGAGSVLRDLYRTSVGHAMAHARPLGQFALACFMIVGGHEERNVMQTQACAHVALAMDDAMGIPQSCDGTRRSLVRGNGCAPASVVARMHNLVQEGAASTTDKGRKAEMEADQAAIADSVDAVRLVTPALADRESYDQTRTAAQSVSAQDGKPVKRKRLETRQLIS